MSNLKAMRMIKVLGCFSILMSGVLSARVAQAWEGSLSDTESKLVFEGVTALADLDNFVIGGSIGGNWLNPAKAVQVAVLDNEDSASRTYQLQINDYRAADNCHFKVCFVKFTLGEGGVYAIQTNQGYVQNRGPQLIGQKAVVSGGGYTFSPTTIEQYNVKTLTLSEFLTATISGDTAWSDIAWNDGRTWVAGPAKLSGEGTVTVTDDVGATKLYVTGGNLKFTGSNTFASEIIVQGGTVTAPLAFAGKITIDEDGVYNVTSDSGNDNAEDPTFVINGGTLANNGPQGLSYGAAGLQKLSVIADSRIGGTHNMYSLARSYGRYDLGLNGHTLTKIGTGDFNFYTATLVGGGAFVAEAGTLRLFDAKLNAGDALVLTAKPDATLTLENNNKGGGIQIAGALDVVNEGAVYFNPAATVRNYTHKGTLSNQGVTVNGLLTLPVSGEMTVPNKITLGASASLALEGEGTLTLGEARPTLTAVAEDVALNVTAGGAEALAGKIRIPTTLETAPAMKVDGEAVEAKVEDGQVVISLSGANTITVAAGETMTITSENLPAANKTVIVEKDAVLDVNGVGDTDFLIVLKGGTLKNGGTNLSDGVKGCWNITLAADSTIEATHNFGSIASGHAQHEIHLNGHTLTKTGASSFWFSNAKFVGGGTVKIAAGKIKFFSGLAKEADTTVDLVVEENGTAEFTSVPTFSSITGAGLAQINFTQAGYYDNFPQAQGFGGGITVEVLGTQSGYFKNGSFDVAMKVTGTFQMNNGYTHNDREGVDQATYLKAISGAGTITKTGTWSAIPLVCAPMSGFTGTFDETVENFFQPYYLTVGETNYYSIVNAIAAASAQSPKLREIPVVGAIPADTVIPEGWHVRGNATNGYTLSSKMFVILIK